LKYESKLLSTSDARFTYSVEFWTPYAAMYVLFNCTVKVAVCMKVHVLLSYR
jgi:hypothetical protein